MPTINFAGLASGIDTNALIDATSEATRATRVKPSQDKVEELTSTNDAFTTLTEKLDTLRSNLQEFSSLSGGGVSKAATSSRESVASATASNAASNGSYALTVTTLATNHTLSFTNGTGYSTTTAPVQSSLTGAEPAADRTATFTIGTGAEQETVDVVVSGPSFSAADFVTQFNANSTKAEASLVNVGTSGSPSYYIVISSSYEGIERGQIGDSYGAALTNLSNVANQNESAATNASISIAGIGTITRGSNTITDVIPGVNLSLVSAGTATIKVAEDAATTQAKIQEFVDTWNDIVQYIAENNTITREESGEEISNTFAALASTRTDDNALSALRTALSQSRSDNGSAVRIFADLGIQTQRDGTLKFDTSKFQTSVAAEPGSVSEVLQDFADTTALTGGTIDVFTRFNGIIDITVNGNKTLITNLNTRISEAEKQITRAEDAMRQRFARLEAVMGQLQQQQSSLTAALSGL